MCWAGTVAAWDLPYRDGRMTRGIRWQLPEVRNAPDVALVERALLAKKELAEVLLTEAAEWAVYDFGRSSYWRLAEHSSVERRCLAPAWSSEEAQLYLALAWRSGAVRICLAMASCHRLPSETLSARLTR